MKLNPENVKVADMVQKGSVETTIMVEIMNLATSGIQWRGCTKADMIKCILHNEHPIDLNMIREMHKMAQTVHDEIKEYRHERLSTLTKVLRSWKKNA